MLGERILLVDDEEEYTRFLGYRLSSRGYKVAIAFSGENAVDMVQGGDIDVIVLDLALPGFDGIEALRRILHFDPDIQVIILSGHATQRAAVIAGGLGAMELLENPVPFDELLRKIVEATQVRREAIERRLSSQSGEILSKWGW